MIQMNNVITQLHNIGANQILNPLEEIKKEIESLKKDLQPKEPTDYLTRKDVAKMFNITLSTLHSWTKKGILKSYGIGSRVYYKRNEINQVLIPLYYYENSNDTKGYFK